MKLNQKRCCRYVRLDGTGGHPRLDLFESERHLELRSFTLGTADRGGALQRNWHVGSGVRGGVQQINLAHPHHVSATLEGADEKYVKHVPNRGSLNLDFSRMLGLGPAQSALVWTNLSRFGRDSKLVLYANAPRVFPCYAGGLAGGDRGGAARVAHKREGRFCTKK